MIEFVTLLYEFVFFECHFCTKKFVEYLSMTRVKYHGRSSDFCHPNSLHIWPLISLLRDNVLAIKRKGMESKQYSLSVWFMACIANHNTTWLLGDTTFLQPNGSSHECTRPTPIQLATLLASNQCCKRGWTGSRVNVIHCVMVKNINHVSSMVAVEKSTDKYMKSTLFLLYNGVDFMTKNNAIIKILDFQTVTHGNHQFIVNCFTYI